MLDLDAIKKRADAATDGPWYVGRPNHAGLSAIEDGRTHGLHTFYAEHHDATFIAHAREDVPVLVDEVERLRRILDKMSSTDGGPAFPVTVAHTPVHYGMTLRDWFAGEALKGMLANPEIDNDDAGHIDFAEFAYAHADAMLAERGKGEADAT